MRLCLMENEIERMESDENLDNLPKQNWTITPEPIVIRGVGHLTMFGLNSHFSTEFPSALTGKLAPEEFHDTLRRVNFVLQRNVSKNLRWLVCGLLFCCCSFGISLWPVVCLNRRTISALEKTLDHENQQLYDKLGLHWKLARMPVEPSNRLTEYVLVLETLPRIPLSIPD